MKLCIVGRGKLGRSLARALAENGVQVELVPGRGKLVVNGADTFILTVPDASIAQAAQRLLPSLSRGNVVLHCAGARGPEELAVCHSRGAFVAGFHPLVSFASARVPVEFADATFVTHGDAQATRRARQIARLLSARCIVAPVLGPAYHAAAALVANGGVALAHAGLDILLALGLPQRDAERALAGLLRSVAHNIERVGLPAALTGPVIRGDADTVARHLAVLSALSPELAQNYAALQPLVLRSACAAGLDSARERRLERVLATSRGSRTTRAPKSPAPRRTRSTRAKARP